jgi:hypothetical protein
LGVIMLSVNILSIIMLGVIMLSVNILNIIMLGVIMMSVIMLGVIMLSVIMQSVIMMNDAEYCDAECHIFIVIQSDDLLNIVMLNVVMLSVLVLIVVAPNFGHQLQPFTLCCHLRPCASATIQLFSFLVGFYNM